MDALRSSEYTSRTTDAEGTCSGLRIQLKREEPCEHTWQSGAMICSKCKKIEPRDTT